MTSVNASDGFYRRLEHWKIIKCKISALKSVLEVTSCFSCPPVTRTSGESPTERKEVREQNFKSFSSEKDQNSHNPVFHVHKLLADS